MTERRLPLMKFTPTSYENDWGSDHYLLCDLGSPDTAVDGGWLGGNALGELMETYPERLAGELSYYYYGRQFPLAVRELTLRGEMPPTVCPDDATAAPRYDALGKAKVWFVLEASDDARLAIGLGRSVSAAEFYQAPGAALQWIRPAVGKAYLIPPGTIHAARGRMRLVEVAEASPLDLRLDNPDVRAEVLDFVCLDPTPAPKGITEVTRPEFSVSVLPLASPQEVTPAEEASFVVYVCVRGAVSLRVPDAAGDHLRLRPGEVALVPAETARYILEPLLGGTVVLEATLGRKEAPDSYINPDAEPLLPGEDYSRDEDEDDRLDWLLSHPEKPES